MSDAAGAKFTPRALASLSVAGEHHLELVVIDAWAMKSVFFGDAHASADAHASSPGPR